ncbi:MAG TPA: PepSY-like domain-containing protein [Bacteroidales bacterium]|nr:PepSY-like domain-containing protein [Bacteroidales bacterium]
MKKFIFISTILLLSMIPLFGQVQINPEEIPQYLRTEFFRKFTTLNPEDVQWYKIGDEYEARFNYQNSQTIYVMSYAGKWIRTESKINDTDLPRITQEYIKKNYPDAIIKEAYMVQSDVLPGYKVILSKNQKDEILNFDKSGNILTNTQSTNKKINVDEQKYKQKISIQTDYLPAKIKDNLYLSYRGYNISKLYWAKDNLNNDYYIVELTDETGSNLVELEFDFLGNQISQTIKNIESENQENQDIKNKKGKKTDLDAGIPETAVPKAAIDYFKKKEKRVDEIKWDTLKNHYIVTYLNTVRGYRCSMEFDEKGTWLQTTIYEDTKNLNPMMSKFINDNYPGYIIQSVENVATNTKEKYLLVKIYSPDWINDPMVYHQLYFSLSYRLEKEVLADAVNRYDFLELQKKAASLSNTQKYLENVDNVIDETELYSGQAVSPKSLPSGIIKYINDNYSGWLLKEAMIIEEDGQYLYNIYLKKEGWPDRIKLTFDYKGNFVNQEKIK